MHQGDLINGLKLTGIYPDRVEFEKYGEMWYGKKIFKNIYFLLAIST